MSKERILITVKTYPTLSRKYGETVCTAGIREDGSWVRMYPVPFRRLDEEQQYKKFDWLECQLLRNPSDPRPETYRPVDQSELKAVDHMRTQDAWRERRRLLLRTARVYDRMDELIEGAKANQVSLAVFKPTRVLDFLCEEDDRDWDPAKLERGQQLEVHLPSHSEAPVQLLVSVRRRNWAAEHAAGARLGSGRALLELPPVRGR